MIDMKKIHMKFDRVLIDEGEMKIKNGQVTGLIGESGSGKTALLQEIGLFGKCQNMTYDFDGVSVDKLSSTEKNEILRQDICFVSQDIYLFSDMTIGEIMRFYASFIDKTLEDDEIYHHLHDVHLQLDIYTPVDTLSGGEKQRLMIACGLLKNAKLFIFDEPFAYLDKKNIENVFEIMQKLAYDDKKMILVSCHDSQMYERFDCIYKIENQHLILMKDKESENVVMSHQSSSFHFQTLIHYIHFHYRKHFVKYMGLGIFIALFVSLMIVMTSFQSQFEKKNGESLMDILKNEICIAKKDKVNHSISPTEVAKLRHQFYDYDVYPDYGFVDGYTVTIKGYLENEKDCFHIYKDLGGIGRINDEEVGNVYMSYSLYRNKYSDTYPTYDLLGNEMTLKVTGILNPSEGDHVIYVPYESLLLYFKNKGVELDLNPVESLRIPIDDIEDISEIKMVLSDDYVLMNNQIIDLSIQAATLFNKDYVKIVSVFALVVLYVYKLFDTLKIRKDYVLLKMNGIENKSLILMKGYQEGLFFLGCFVLTLILDCMISAILHLLSLSTFIDIIIMVGLSYLGLYIFLMIVEIILVYRVSTTKLLRMNIS